MRERLKHKYALSEQGVNDMIKAVIIVTIANLAFMVPVGLLHTSSTTQHSSQLMWKVESEDVHWQRN